MPHQHAHKDAAIAGILLLGRVVEVDEADGLAGQLGDFEGGKRSFLVVGGVHGVVVEGEAVEEADEEEGPVGAAFGELDVGAVVDGEEDVGCGGEVGEGVFEGGGVGRLH